MKGNKRLQPMIFNAKNIGERFRELRLMRGMTLDQVAELAGTKTPNVSRFESGQFKNPTINSLNMYALAIGARVEIHVNLIDHPERVAYQKVKRVLRDAQRPHPKTSEGVRMRALSNERSPKKLPRPPLFP